MHALWHHKIFGLPDAKPGAGKRHTGRARIGRGVVFQNAMIAPVKRDADAVGADPVCQPVIKRAGPHREDDRPLNAQSRTGAGVNQGERLRRVAGCADVNRQPRKRHKPAAERGLLLRSRPCQRKADRRGCSGRPAQMHDLVIIGWRQHHPTVLNRRIGHKQKPGPLGQGDGQGGRVRRAVGTDRQRAASGARQGQTGTRQQRDVAGASLSANQVIAGPGLTRCIPPRGRHPAGRKHSHRSKRQKAGPDATATAASATTGISGPHYHQLSPPVRQRARRARAPASTSRFSRILRDISRCTNPSKPAPRRACPTVLVVPPSSRT